MFWHNNYNYTKYNQPGNQDTAVIIVSSIAGGLCFVLLGLILIIIVIACIIMKRRKLKQRKKGNNNAIIFASMQRFDYYVGILLSWSTIGIISVHVLYYHTLSNW